MGAGVLEQSVSNDEVAGHMVSLVIQCVARHRVPIAAVALSPSITRRRVSTSFFFHVQSCLQGGSKLFTLLLFHVQSRLQSGSKSLRLSPADDFAPFSSSMSSLFYRVDQNCLPFSSSMSSLFYSVAQNSSPISSSISSPVYLVAPKTSTSTLRRLFTFLLFHVQSRLQGGTKSEFTLFDCLHL